MVSNFFGEIPFEQIFEMLSWPKIRNIFFRASCLMVYKCLHEAAPQILCDKFIYIEEVSSRTTRSTNKMIIRVPYARTTFYQKSFFVTGPLHWNELPERLRFIQNIKQFKWDMAKWEKKTSDM